MNYRKPATGILSGAERQLLLEFEQIAESKCQRLRRTDKRKVEAFKAGRVAVRNAYEYGRTLVTNSEPPIPAKRKGIALTTVQQDLVIASATGPWCIMTYVTVDAALGARRGEVLALRWRDLENGRATIARSLSQNKKGLTFKNTKEENVLVIGLPPSALAALEAHRKKQDRFRAQFGPAYRNDLDLIFAEPDGTPLKPNSISATVSALFRRVKIPKPKGSSAASSATFAREPLLANGVRCR